MNTARWAGTNDDRLYSGTIWGDCPWRDIVMGDVLGVAVEVPLWNFRTSANVNAATAHWMSGFKLFGSDGAAVAVVDAVGGGTTFSSDGDDEGVSFGTMGFPFQLDRDKGKFWLEARIKTSTITDTKHGFFLGLIDDAALSATVPIAAAGTLADENFVGFHRLEGDGDKLDTVYKANGVTQVTVGTDAVTLVADTYVNIGMKFTPKGHRSGDYRLSFYADGVELADSKEIPAADGTDFPNDVRLGLVFALLNATASTPGSTSLTLFRAAQLL